MSSFQPRDRRGHSWVILAIRLSLLAQSNVSNNGVRGVSFEGNTAKHCLFNESQKEIGLIEEKRRGWLRRMSQEHSLFYCSTSLLNLKINFYREGDKNYFPRTFVLKMHEKSDTFSKKSKLTRYLFYYSCYNFAFIYQKFTT